MKKISVLICLILCFMMIVPYALSAEAVRVFPNDPITVPKATPTIDGTIKSDEGWSKVAYLNEDTAGYFYGQNQLTSTTDFYFAFSDEGLYFAANLTEYKAAYTVRFYDENGETTHERSYIDPNAGEYSSTNYPKTTPDGTVIEAAIQPPSYDYILPDGGRNAYWYSTSGNSNVYCESEEDSLDQVYGFDGDVIALMIDPNGVFNSAKLYGPTDYTPQYNFGIFKGDVVKVKTSRVAGELITDKCQAKGKLTDTNITFEAFIPWEQIVKDMNEMAANFSLDHTFTKEEMIASGAEHRASVTLMDRFYDEEAGYIDSWGRNVTVCDICDNGDYGITVGPPIKGMGLRLIMEGTAADSNSASGNGNSSATVTDEKGNVISGGDASKTSATTKAAGTNAGTKGGSSAGTGDAGIIVAIAIGAAAICGIVAVSKKKTGKR